MALHPEFPESPYAALLPDRRWFPAAEELRSTAYEKLLPPLVAKIRSEIMPWRDAGYAGASETSRGLLNWWFETEAPGRTGRRHAVAVPLLLRAARSGRNGDLAA